ncbi:magnesium transporter [Galenea microaerophila]
MQQEEILRSREKQLLELQALLEQNKPSEVCAFFKEHTPAEIANLLESFPIETRLKLWQCIPEEERGEVLAELSDDVRTTLMEQMDSEDVTEVTKDLDAQEISEILDTVDEEIKEDVINQLDEETKEQVEKLQSYDKDVVGHYMDPETVNVKEDVTLETVQRFVRMKDLLDDETQEILVVDKAGHLVGTISLVDLIKYPQEDLVKAHMRQPVALIDTMDIRDAASILRAKGLHFAPVVNEEGKLVGQLNIDDIMEIISEDDEATMMNMSGVSEEDDLFAPIPETAKSRAVWLGINLATAFLASFVIGQFEDVLSKVVALAVLMPVVASMGGIAGSQTLAVVIRGLALGQIGGNNRWWLFNKELWVGLINGVIWAIVVAVIAQLWFNNTMISLVIFLAIIINMTIANLSGIAIPLLLKKMGIDPALSGAVILTTITDVAGFLSFLGLATLFILHQ